MVKTEQRIPEEFLRLTAFVDQSNWEKVAEFWGIEKNTEYEKISEMAVIKENTTNGEFYDQRP